MFAKTIIDSDAFLDMPTTTQNLYFHLAMRADDDGFVNKPRAVMRVTGSKDDDLKLLIAKKFILPFEDGVIVIKHWRIHNYIQKDRYNETKYVEHKGMLDVDENNAYTFKDTKCIQDVHEVETQVRLGKVRLGKDKKDKHIDLKKSFGEYVYLTEHEHQKLIEKYGEIFTKTCIEKLDNYKGSSGKKYTSDYRAILTWVIEDVSKKLSPKTPTTQNSTAQVEIVELDM